MQKIYQPTLIIFFLSSIFFASGKLLAQDSSQYPKEVFFKIYNSKNEPVPYASIHVQEWPDTSRKLSRNADSTGKALIPLHQDRQYKILITAVNYISLQKGVKITAVDSLLNFVMEPLGKTMETAIVFSKRPMITQDDDKTIIDPESLVEASTNGYEVLEKTPGLFVDQDGNIYISSLSPASVQINGREMKMSASDIATMLKSLPPNTISKIEIVRTPSAKYDASGTGGVVNVVLKKGVKIGLTGSLNAGFQQGVYGSQFAGFNLSNNDGKKSSYINFNINSRNSYEIYESSRFFGVDSLLNQHSNTHYPSTSYYTGYGISSSIGKKWELDFTGSLSLNDFNNSTNDNSTILKTSSPSPIIHNVNFSNNDGTSFNLTNGLQAKLKIDSTGSEWVNDFSFYYGSNKSNQFYTTQFILPAALSFNGDGDIINKRYFYNYRSDLKLKLANRFTVETGVKIAWQTFSSVTNFFKDVNGNRQKDIARTNTFHYQESINAAYLQGSKTFGKNIILKAGGRLENTNMDGRQIIPGDTSFTIRRNDFFPYLYLSKKLMTIAGWELRGYLVYRRTITRPVYEQLNPFSRFVNLYLSETGNPSLRPQFTQNYEANVSVDERPILAVGVNDTKDIFTNVIYQADSNHIQAIRTYDNLGKNKEWYFRGLGAIPPGKKYFFVLGGQYNHNFYNGTYENKPLSYKRGTWTFFTYHSYKLDRRSQISLNGFLRLKGQQQFYELGSFGALNASINRTFIKNKLTITLSMSDLFFTNNNTFTISQGTVNASGYRESDSRRVGLNLRYNFGIRKKEENTSIFNGYTPPAN